MATKRRTARIVAGYSNGWMSTRLGTIISPNIPNKSTFEDDFPFLGFVPWRLELVFLLKNLST